MDELRHRLTALPKLLALRDFRERIKPLADIPDAPIDWVDEISKLQIQEIEITTRATAVELEISTISDEIKRVSVDDRLLDFAERVELLADLRARYLTADKDIPERRLQLRDVDNAIVRILARLERDPETQPDSLLLSASTLGSLRELMEQRSAIAAGIATAEEELVELAARLADAQAKLQAKGGETHSPFPSAESHVASIVSLAQASDHAARRRLAERARQEHVEALSQCAPALLPWLGEAGDLRDLSVPDHDDIELWNTSITAAQNRIERHAGEIDRILADERRLKAEIEAVRQAVGVERDQEAAEIRAIREHAWAVHKGTLDAQSAEHFEVSLRRDDIATNNRIRNAAGSSQSQPG